MRKLLFYITLILAISFMTVSCCHKHKDNQAKTTTNSTITITTTTDSQKPSDKSEKSDKTISSDKADLQLQSDTAVRTDWRITARRNAKIYSPSLLNGEWQNGNLHHQYRSDGTGSRWDISDDVNRHEAQGFSWTMDSNSLTMYFVMEFGSVVPKEYLVTFVDDETLVYRDAYGTSYMWDKVPQDMNLELQ